MRDASLHEQLRRLYRDVTSCAITPAQYELLAPRNTPQEWFQYLRTHQFTVAQLPRLCHPLRELFDAPPGKTNNVSEHMHADAKAGDIPSAPGDILCFVLGPPNGAPSGFVFSRWQRRADVLSAREDLPQYAARSELTQSVAHMASLHAASHTAPLRADPLRRGTFMRDDEDGAGGAGHLFVVLGWDTPGFAPVSNRGQTAALPMPLAELASSSVLDRAAAIVVQFMLATPPQSRSVPASSSAAAAAAAAATVRARA